MHKHQRTLASMKRLLLFFTLITLFAPLIDAQWQWRVSVSDWISGETGTSPDAFLWIPENCQKVNAVMFANQNMDEETLFELPSFRKHLSEMGIALIWFAPMLEQQWDVKTGVQQSFDNTLRALAEVSGYDEIATSPLIPFGHSAQATMPWNFAAWNPNRTLCIISFHGDAPRTNLCGYGRENLEWGRTRNIDGIPSIMIVGEYEWWDARVLPALAFKMKYPGSCISFLGDAGRGHFDVSEQTADYIALFIRKTLETRPDLEKIKPEDGWLAQWWRPSDKKRAAAAPVNKYKGNPHEAFWYFDKEMAKLAEQRYTATRHKQPTYLNFRQNGKLLNYDDNQHIKTRAVFSPEADGITYHLNVQFTDSTHNNLSDNHPDIKPSIKRICGPVKVINDSTFRVDFYRIGINNSKRSWDMVLCAEAPGNRIYKESVQQIEIKLPGRHENGKRQTIFFPSIDDVPEGTESIALNATTDRNLPVSYFVKEGPAVVEGNNLIITGIPPRSKFPVKVVVVAWQYGKTGEVNTAEPVEQTFYITK